MSVLPPSRAWTASGSASMLVTGQRRCVSSVTFDSLDALERSREQAALDA